MNFLITGATGFIGGKLVDLLLSKGHSINYLARARKPRLDSRAAFHHWDSNSELPLNSVPRLDAVIHLAGEPIAQRWTPAVKQRIYDSRVQSTRKLVEAMRELRYKPAVLVSASAIGYYGDRGDEVLTEESAGGAGFLAELCADWEREAARAREFGMRVIPVRIASVLGKEGGALPQMLQPFKLGLGGRFGSGKQWMSWIHIDDVARLLAFAAESDGSGALNGSSPQPVTNAEFTQALSRAIHRPAPWSIPKFAMRLAVGEMAEFLFESLRVLPQAAQKAGFRFEYPELNGALRSLL
jgi:uncharacterized protein (TIGR01777 family)